MAKPTSHSKTSSEQFEIKWQLDPRMRGPAWGDDPWQLPQLSLMADPQEHFEDKMFLEQVQDPERPSPKEIKQVKAQWNSMTPSDQQLYLDMATPDILANNANQAEYNRRVPLSPSVDGSPGPNTYRWRDQTSINRGAQKWNRYRRDHPKACGGPIAPIPDRPFPFLSLPIEIRREVIRFYLQRPREVTQMPDNCSANSDRQNPVDLRLLAVSRQMLSETEGLLYATNIIHVSFQRLDDLPLWVRKPCSAATFIRRVHIVMKTVHEDVIEDYKGSLRRVVSVLKLCASLALVKVTLWGLEWEKEGPNPMMDDLLECIKTLRGVRSVVFAASGRDLLGCHHNCEGSQAQRDQAAALMMQPLA